MSIDYYSNEAPGVESLTNKLFNDTSHYLINHIYNNKNIYKTPEVRVGLVIIIMIKTDRYYDHGLLNQVIEDINSMIHDDDYLNTFQFPEDRKKNLQKELLLINKQIQLTDTISLNR